MPVPMPQGKQGAHVGSLRRQIGDGVVRAAGAFARGTPQALTLDAQALSDKAPAKLLAQVVVQGSSSTHAIAHQPPVPFLSGMPHDCVRLSVVVKPQRQSLKQRGLISLHPQQIVPPFCTTACAVAWEVCAASKVTTRSSSSRLSRNGCSAPASFVLSGIG